MRDELRLRSKEFIKASIQRLFEGNQRENSALDNDLFGPEVKEVIEKGTIEEIKA